MIRGIKDASVADVCHLANKFCQKLVSFLHSVHGLNEFWKSFKATETVIQNYPKIFMGFQHAENKSKDAA